MCIFKRKKQPDTKEKTESDNNGWYWKTLGFVVITTIVLWGIAIIAAKCFDFGISEDSAAITVIGAVAGIVVIGNFAQVNEIKTNLDKKIAEVERRQDAMDLEVKKGRTKGSKKIPTDPEDVVEATNKTDKNAKNNKQRK